ncbi:MAG: J domain-containing protein [Planctomycetota bacterium]
MSQTHEINFDADYYGILQVEPSASDDEIQRSFKRLVLEHHPDKNPDRRDWSERHIRQLIEANDVLGNTEKRRVFDRFRRTENGATTTEPEEPFFFRRKGPGARALMVLHLLLHSKPDEAVNILKEQEGRYGHGYLHEYLEKRDYLDCLFLLAEYFLSEKRFLEALTRLRSFYDCERSTKYRRHYFEEVKRLLVDLYLRKLPRILAPERALEVLKEAEGMKLSANENVLRLKKIAESQAKLGDRRAARQTLEDLHTLDPQVKGLEQIEALLAS